jgi:very-short-patch-repair endonuclease
MSLKVTYPPPQWVVRTNQPYQKIDQVNLDKYYARYARLIEKDSISPFEYLLAIKLRSIGYKTESQYAIPDMNAGDIFYWYYDLYVPKLDMLIEVQGRSHRDKDQIVKDARKRSLARMQGFNFKEIQNKDVNDINKIRQVLEIL